jgi:hypothetical protein
VNPLPRWPLVPIAAPAAVAIWSGWVGLGGMCGFGDVQPFPGIVAWHLDTAITLPIGVEAYGAYALGAWLTPGTPQTARTFARRSAIGALVLGAAGQVVYHLLAAARATRAPWPVVVLVSCLPVITLGFGAALTHLLREGAPEIRHEQSDSEAGIRTAGADVPPQISTPGGDLADAPAGVPEPVPDFAALNGHRARAERLFAKDIEAGRIPGVRRIRDGLHVGQPKAKVVQAYLRSLITTQ